MKNFSWGEIKFTPRIGERLIRFRSHLHLAPILPFLQPSDNAVFSVSLAFASPVGERLPVQVPEPVIPSPNVSLDEVTIRLCPNLLKRQKRYNHPAILTNLLHLEISPTGFFNKLTAAFCRCHYAGRGLCNSLAGTWQTCQVVTFSVCFHSTCDD